MKANLKATNMREKIGIEFIQGASYEGRLVDQESLIADLMVSEVSVYDKG